MLGAREELFAVSNHEHDHDWQGQCAKKETYRPAHAYEKQILANERPYLSQKQIHGVSRSTSAKLMNRSGVVALAGV